MSTKDILGNELNVGDKVVFGKAQKMALHTGFIVQINKKTVKIEHEEYRNGWNDTIVSQRAFEDVVKVEK